MLNKLERKFGKYAISNLTLKLLILYAIGYVLRYVAGNSSIYTAILLSPAHVIHQFQIWRLFSWVLVSPNMTLVSFLITAVFFYYPIGRKMESVWGDFRYNLYLFSGLLFTLIGAFLLYGFYAVTDPANLAYYNRTIAAYFTPYYVTMSIFFAYAATFPEDMVLLMFIVPLKMKYLGIIYGAFLAYEFFMGTTVTKVVIIVSVLNFILYWIIADRTNIWRMRPKEVKRRKTYQKAVQITPPGMPRHRCTICGRTELDDPNLEFRYCSKCSGSHEYCQDHLFTHVHIK